MQSLQPAGPPLKLAALYRKVDSGEIKSQEGTRRAYILPNNGDIIALAELEGRIRELEGRYMREAQRG